MYFVVKIRNLFIVTTLKLIHMSLLSKLFSKERINIEINIESIYKNIQEKNQRLEDRYNQSISNIIEITKNTKIKSSKNLLKKLNETIDNIQYNKEYGYLSKVLKDESRHLSKEKVEYTLSSLKKIRNQYPQEESEFGVKENIQNIKNLVQNKLPKKRFDSRLPMLKNQLQIIKNKKISQEDFDEIAYNFKRLEKNYYLKNKEEYKEQRQEVLDKFKTILERRYTKPKKRKMINYLRAGFLVIGSALIISSFVYAKNQERTQKEREKITEIKKEYNELIKERNKKNVKKNTVSYQFLVAENEYKDSIYRQRYLKYKELFEKYSRINRPEGYTEKEFKAILAGIGRIETSMGTAKTAGKNDNELGEKWLMGFTAGERYPEKFAGPEKQIRLASKRIKDALEGKERYYEDIIYKKTKDEKIKYVLSVYNSGYGLEENSRGQLYVSKIYPYIKGWIEYFNIQNTH